MNQDKLKIINELDEFYQEYDKKFPEWFRTSRLLARKIYREYEENDRPVGKFGKDFDLLSYRPDIDIQHKKIDSLTQLSKERQIIAETAGQSITEKDRLGSKLQQDSTTTYLKFTDIAKKNFLAKYHDALIVEDIEEAIVKYPYIEKLLSHILPINLDKYTAFNASYSRGGVFVYIKRGAKAELPLQACFFIETQNFAQLPRILVIAEPYSKLHLISGCVTHPKCATGLHGCLTEIYVGEGAEVTYSMIHNFQEEFHIRPKIAAIVDKDATYIENFIIIGKCASDQAYPTAILRGKNARAVIRCIILGISNSDIDVGSCIIFTGENTRAELISRAVITDTSKVTMRGNLKCYAKNVTGHLECRGLLLSDGARAFANPQLRSIHPNANLTHEAAIGKIQEEQLYYLMSRGLSEEEATSLIARGFLDVETEGFPQLLREEINKIIEMSLKKVL